MNLDTKTCLKHSGDLAYISRTLHEITHNHPNWPQYVRQEFFDAATKCEAVSFFLSGDDEKPAVDD